MWCFIKVETGHFSPVSLPLTSSYCYTFPWVIKYITHLAFIQPLVFERDLSDKSVPIHTVSIFSNTLHPLCGPLFPPGAILLSSFSFFSFSSFSSFPLWIFFLFNYLQIHQQFLFDQANCFSFLKCIFQFCGVYLSPFKFSVSLLRFLLCKTWMVCLESTDLTPS